MKKAPWTTKEVEALNRHQKDSQFHPFTCPHHGDPRDLIATVGGWTCPQCDYTQDWAHESMIEAGRARGE